MMAVEKGTLRTVTISEISAFLGNIGSLEMNRSVQAVQFRAPVLRRLRTDIRAYPALGREVSKLNSILEILLMYKTHRK